MRSKRARIPICLVVVFVQGVAGADLAAGGESEPAAIAEMTVAEAIEWRPRVGYQQLVLTVSGPYDYLRLEFKAGEPVRLEALGADGQALPDGRYRYELRILPLLDPEVERTLEAARTRDDRKVVQRKLRRSGLLPNARVQSGVFTVRGGKVLPPDPKVEEPKAEGG